VVCLTTSLLALTRSVTWRILEAQQDKETLDMIQTVFPEASSYTLENDIYTVYDNSGEKIGYAFYAEGMGKYVWGGPEAGTKIPGPIVILVGLEDKETIKGIFVVSHSETPGFWNWLIKENYFDQFIELKIKDAYFTRDGGQVDAATYATLSSTLVLDTVREAAMDKVKLIK